MGKEKRDRRDVMRAHYARAVQLPNERLEFERYMDLAQSPNCETANLAQAMLYLSAGEERAPILCPHCGQVPTAEELFKGRLPCEVIGHPEQWDVRRITGGNFIPCVLCGETPTSFSDWLKLRGIVHGDEEEDGPEPAPLAEMPERVTRHWIVEHSDKEEGLGSVKIPDNISEGIMGGIFTHAMYSPQCEHDEEDYGHCDEDVAVEWELVEYSGGE